VKRWVAALASLFVVGCGGKTPTGPGPGVVDPITLICPSDIRIENVPTASLAVTYSTPTTTGGVPPIAISCAIVSGAVFNLGETVVVCTGTDGVRFGQCQFKVTLVASIPLLRLTNFLAFGDSITAGENGEDARVRIIDVPNSYEMQLQTMLAQHYTAQMPTVGLDGIGGETAVQGATRIAADLDVRRPEVLLLLEGVNDLNGDLTNNQRDIINSLRSDILAAKVRGIVTFVSTLLPEDPKGYRAHNADEIGPVNAAIRALAAEQGVTLVDTNAAYGIHGVVGDYLDADGLHPTAAGNHATALAFFAAIQATLEVPVTSSSLAPAARRFAVPIGRGRSIK
jgi:lysophospholipase L1-like esterase